MHSIGASGDVFWSRAGQGLLIILLVCHWFGGFSGATPLLPADIDNGTSGTGSEAARVMARREPAPKTQDSAPTDFSISAPAVPTYSFPSYSYSMPDWLSSITDPSYSIPPDYFSATSSCDSFDTLIGTCLTPDIPMPTYSFPIPDSGGDGGKKNADSVVPNISEVGHAMKTSLKKIIGVVVGSVLGLFGLVS